ncbi:MAG TPA: SDR family NAD(P)-dependent oxidoreductase [Nocardioidaceae bacterium]|nr:SDR family NAD(P)-dependent oxidoreductase [Nocardioidaceae bacterium]
MIRVPDRVARGIDTALDRTVAPGYTRIGSAVRRRLPTWPDDPAPAALAGRHVLVTGASSGLGIATAEGLAQLGAVVHLVVRDEAKGSRVRDEILARVPQSSVQASLVVDRCDVSDLEDVRRFCRELEPDRLAGVVHNAGAMPPERTESRQGHEQTMALHVLGPVLMTELLLPRLEPGARVVLVTSGGMYSQRLRDDDPQFLQGDYSGVTAYARSKRAQVELLPVLAARWPGVVVAATHPGWADTPGVAESLPRFRRITGPFLRDAEDGADTTVWLVGTDTDPGSGLLWHDRRPRPTHLMRSTRTGEAERARLWAWVQDQLELQLTPDA